MSKSTETGVTPQGRGSHKRSLWRGQSVGHMAIVLLNYKGNLSCLAERVGFGTRENSVAQMLAA